MPALDLLQSQSDGCIEQDDLPDIAEMLDISTADVFGVFSYYSMYNKKAVGKYHLQVDTNIPAMLMGSEEILSFLEEKLGIKVSETTDDGMFTLSEVEDLGSCGTAPVIQVNDRYYENMTIQKTEELISSLRKGVMPDWKSTDNFDTQCNVLLKRRGVSNSTSIDTYIADDGYKAWEKAQKIEPAAIIEEVKQSGLRGLGGAGFPTGTKYPQIQV